MVLSETFSRLTTMVQIVEAVFSANEERQMEMVWAMIQATWPLSKDFFSSSPDIALHIVHFLADLTRLPFAQPPWRTLINEAFHNDPQFFDFNARAVPDCMSHQSRFMQLAFSQTFNSGCRIVNNTLIQDKTSWPELLRSLTKSTVPQGGLSFVRSADTSARPFHNLAFALYAGISSYYSPLTSLTPVSLIR